MFQKLNKPTYILVILFFIALIVFSSSLTNLAFFWDDERFVFDNPSFLKAPNIFYFWIKNSEFFKSWPLGYSYFYFINKTLDINNLFIFKIINIFLHTLNAFSFYKILIKFKSKFPILLCLLFLIHPLHVENVSWIFQSLTLLATFFLLQSYRLFLNYLDESKLWWLFLSFVFFQFSLWSKSIHIFFPFLLVFQILLFKKKIQTLFIIPFFIISFISGIELIVGTKTHSNFQDKSIQYKKGIINKLENINKSLSLKVEKGSDKFLTNDESKMHDFVYVKPAKTNYSEFNTFKVLSQAPWHYFTKLIFPINQQFIYKKIDSWFFSFFIIFIFILLAAICIFKRKTYLTLVFSFTLISIFSYLGFSFISFFYWANVSDRYTYLFVFSLPLFINYFTFKFNFKFWRHSLIVLVLIFSIMSFFYSNVFNSPIELYKRTLTQISHPVIYSNLFEQYLIRLDTKNAEIYLNDGLKLFPNDLELKRNIVRLEALKNNLRN